MRGPVEVQPADALGTLARLLAERGASAPLAVRRERAERLHGHVADYLLPRAQHLQAPLTVVLLGSTGAGKSSLFNALAGRPVSDVGVLRPTTRSPMLLAHPDDIGVLERGELLPGLMDRSSLEIVADPEARRGLFVVDAPDFDSVELANHALAAQLLEAADLLIFVTTADRYADQVPWTVLERAEQRGVPMLTLLNRLPPDRDDAMAVIEDYRRLLEQGRLADSGAFGRLEIVPIAEGLVDPERSALDPNAIAPIRAALDQLVSDEDARREVARRSLAAALAGLPTAVEEVAREVDEEQSAIQGLMGIARRAFSERRRAMGDELARGTFMRAEVLRQWQEFVGAGRVARFLAEGIGRVAATIRSFIQPGPPATAGDVREAAFADLVALAVTYVDAASQRTATEWSEDRYGSDALVRHPELWAASEDLPQRLTAALERWAGGIGERIARYGQQRRGWARAASIGVNVMGTAVILAVFTHTGGLTGAEVGITAATAFVNQKLLEAIFGEANVQSFVSEARAELGQTLDEAFTTEETRFAQALGPMAESTELARQLRAAATAATAQHAA